jgi:hypothetical protein
MKHSIGLLTFIICLLWSIVLDGQTAVEITGTVRSGSPAKVEISFWTTNGHFLTTCISGPDGKFRSGRTFKVGDTINFKLEKRGYEPLESARIANGTGDVGEFLMNLKKIAIYGSVRDSINKSPVEKAEISIVEESKFVVSGSTNSKGDFDVVTAHEYGDAVTIRVFKDGYYIKEETHPLTKDGRMPDMLLPRINDRAIKVSINVRDKKSDQLLGGVKVKYYDNRRSKFVDTVSSSDGELQLIIFQAPRTDLRLTLSKSNYNTTIAVPTIYEDHARNIVDCKLERKKRSVIGPVLITGAGISALFAGAMYLSSNQKYNSYKDFSNPDRENDYNAAQSRRNLAVIGAAVATGTLVTYFIYKINHRNKERIKEDSKQTVFNRVSLSAPSYSVGNLSGIGIIYQL